jgi:hypothetical protein
MQTMSGMRVSQLPHCEVVWTIWCIHWNEKHIQLDLDHELDENLTDFELVPIVTSLITKV